MRMADLPGLSPPTSDSDDDRHFEESSGRVVSALAPSDEPIITDPNKAGCLSIVQTVGLRMRKWCTEENVDKDTVRFVSKQRSRHEYWHGGAVQYEPSRLAPSLTALLVHFLTRRVVILAEDRGLLSVLAEPKTRKPKLSTSKLARAMLHEMQHPGKECPSDESDDEAKAASSVPINVTLDSVTRTLFQIKNSKLPSLRNRYLAVQKSLKQLLKTVEFDVVVTDTGRPELYFFETTGDGGRFAVSCAAAAGAHYEALMVVASLFAFPKATTVVLDEPGRSFHPPLQRDLRELIFTSQRDLNASILVVSHSADMLAESVFDQVFRCTRRTRDNTAADKLNTTTYSQVKRIGELEQRIQRSKRTLADQATKSSLKAIASPPASRRNTEGYVPLVNLVDHMSLLSAGVSVEVFCPLAVAVQLSATKIVVTCEPLYAPRVQLWFNGAERGMPNDDHGGPSWILPRSDLRVLKAAHSPASFLVSSSAAPACFSILSESADLHLLAESAAVAASWLTALESPAPKVALLGSPAAAAVDDELFLQATFQLWLPPNVPDDSQVADGGACRWQVGKLLLDELGLQLSAGHLQQLYVVSQDTSDVDELEGEHHNQGNQQPIIELADVVAEDVPNYPSFERRGREYILRLALLNSDLRQQRLIRCSSQKQAQQVCATIKHIALYCALIRGYPCSVTVESDTSAAEAPADSASGASASAAAAGTTTTDSARTDAQHLFPPAAEDGSDTRESLAPKGGASDPAAPPECKDDEVLSREDVELLASAASGQSPPSVNAGADLAKRKDEDANGAAESSEYDDASAASAPQKYPTALPSIMHLRLKESGASALRIRSSKEPLHSMHVREEVSQKEWSADLSTHFHITGSAKKSQICKFKFKEKEKVMHVKVHLANEDHARQLHNLTALLVGWQYCQQYTTVGFSFSADEPPPEPRSPGAVHLSKKGTSISLYVGPQSKETKLDMANLRELKYTAANELRFTFMVAANLLPTPSGAGAAGSVAATPLHRSRSPSTDPVELPLSGANPFFSPARLSATSPSQDGTRATAAAESPARSPTTKQQVLNVRWEDKFQPQVWCRVVQRICPQLPSVADWSPAQKPDAAGKAEGKGQGKGKGNSQPPVDALAPSSSPVVLDRVPRREQPIQKFLSDPRIRDIFFCKAVVFVEGESEFRLLSALQYALDAQMIKSDVRAQRLPWDIIPLSTKTNSRRAIDVALFMSLRYVLLLDADALWTGKEEGEDEEEQEEAVGSGKQQKMHAQSYFNSIASQVCCCMMEQMDCFTAKQQATLHRLAALLQHQFSKESAVHAIRLFRHVFVYLWPLQQVDLEGVVNSSTGLDVRSQKKRFKKKDWRVDFSDVIDLATEMASTAQPFKDFIKFLNDSNATSEAEREGSSNAAALARASAASFPI